MTILLAISLITLKKSDKIISLKHTINATTESSSHALETAYSYKKKFNSSVDSSFTKQSTKLNQLKKTFLDQELDLSQFKLGKTSVNHYRVKKGIISFIASSAKGKAYFSIKNNNLSGNIIYHDGHRVKINYDSEQDMFYSTELPPEKLCACSLGQLKAPLKAASQENLMTDTGTSPLPQIAADSGDTTVTMLMLYNEDAKETAERNGDTIDLLIAQAETEAIDAFSNSLTGVKIEIIAHAEVNFDKNKSDSEILDDLQGRNDGQMDEVHTIREIVGADLVCLMYDTTEVGGIAFIYGGNASTSRKFAFSIVDTLSIGYLTFPHEIGHNFGCGHAKNQTINPGPGLYEYSAGFYPGPYRTVMAYQKSGQTRIPYFSTPDTKYNGWTLGDADNDNVRTIELAKSGISAYQFNISYSGVDLKASWSGESDVIVSWSNSTATGATGTSGGVYYRLYEVDSPGEYLRYEGTDSNIVLKDVYNTDRQYKLYFVVDGTQFEPMGGGNIANLSELNLNNTELIINHNQKTGIVERRFIDQSGNTVLSGNVFSAPIPITWKLKGQKDINQDGVKDLIWHNQSDGNVGYWLISDKGLLTDFGQVYSGPIPPSHYQVASLGKVDSDNIPDIIWHGPLGFITTWTLNSNGTLKNGSFISTDSDNKNWEINVSGDINKDSVTDIIMHNKITGQIKCWLMNSDSSIKEEVIIYSGNIPYSQYRIAALIDMNKDGHLDLIWHGPLGYVSVWYLNSDASLQSGAFISQNTSFQAKTLHSILDVNNDDILDFIWYDNNTHAMSCWILNNDLSIQAVKEFE